jgi:hypothetical protein
MVTYSYRASIRDVDDGTVNEQTVLRLRQRRTTALVGLQLSMLPNASNADAVMLLC